MRQGGQQLIHPLTNTATASSLCCLRLADRLGVPRDAAYKLYYNSVPKKDTAHPKQTKHYTTAYAAEKKTQTDKKRQAAATATAAAVTTAAASNDANTNTDTCTPHHSQSFHDRSHAITPHNTTQPCTIVHYTPHFFPPFPAPRPFGAKI